jgi:hypothetical protein
MAKRKRLDQFAHRIAKQIEQRKVPDLTNELADYLDSHPDLALESLEAFVRAVEAESGPTSLAEAYLVLMGKQLEFLRYGTDRNLAWANEMVDAFQRRLAELARSGRLDGGLVAAVAGALREAKISPTPDLVAAIGDLFENDFDPDDAPSPADLDEVLAELVEVSSGDPFAIADSLAETLYATPTAVRQVLAGTAAGCEFPEIREAAALMILDPDPEIRRGVVTIFERDPKALTPEAFRRMIAVRNWLPEVDRAALDRAARAARSIDAACASWPDGEATEIHASAIDGAGAQGFLIVSRAGKRHRISSVLIRHDTGILDAWSGAPATKKEVSDTLDHAHQSTAIHTISREFLDRAVCHGLATSMAAGTPPPLGLIQVAEAIGGATWNPSLVDWRAEADALVALMPEALGRLDTIESLLKDCGAWIWADPVAESWFEDDATVTELLHKHRRRSEDVLIDMVLREILEPRRDVWAERFLWTALWMKEGSPGDDRLWCGFAATAREMANGRPLDQIPVMEEIAVATAEIHAG